MPSSAKPKRTPPSRKERAENPVSGEAPDVAATGGGRKIEPVDLSLHGDGIDHWQDELPAERKARKHQREKKD